MAAANAGPTGVTADE
nr:hypothetical protein [Escherichia coli]